MSVFTGILVFTLIWWVVLFTVLPWGLRVPDEQEPGHASSAPTNPNLVKKFIITTVIATLLFGVAYFLIESDLISFRNP